MIPLELEGPGVCFEGPKSALGAPKVVYCICKVVYKYTGCPKKNALLSLEANISGFKGPIGQSWTSFENYMFSAFIWAQEQVNFIPAWKLEN